MFDCTRTVAISATLITFGTIAPAHAAFTSNPLNLSLSDFRQWSETQTSTFSTNDRLSSEVAIRAITAPSPNPHPFCSLHTRQSIQQCLRLPSTLPRPYQR
ncbi:MAG: hypothetical protein HY785_28890 [Oscillatoriophycideae cyanobacterium NC_groundwater_1537_Pr4_S-0.65um_50_18]|nr:hypothetical protein [Oscillatoriophycideae cyanobacterium NC_groundwater_1537_Pr4_S-0.65um_50_18]